MAEYATKDEVREIVREAVDDLSEIIANFASQVDERFNRIEERLEKIEKSHDRLLNTIDGFVKRLDEVETEQLARDRQFDRLVAWAHKVSEKTGIPLENL
jgi:septal ring factor EnvC (AmiA/AmiB activator)